MLKYRLISGFLSIAGMILAVTVLPPFGNLAILLVLSYFGQRELFVMLRNAGMKPYTSIAQLCGITLILVSLLSVGPEHAQMIMAHNRETMVLLVVVIAVFVRYITCEHDAKSLSSIGATLFSVLYVPFMLSFFAGLAYGWDGAQSGQGLSSTGRHLVLYAVIVIKSTDIGAYTLGRMFGRHKLWPRVSPGKTWEGFFGGIFVAMLASYLYYHFSGGQLGVITLEIRDVVLLGVILSVIGVAGDLFASSLKRAGGVKDSGSSVPGMGGVLDVFDSLLFGVPVIYMYMRVLMS